MPSKTSKKKKNPPSRKRAKPTSSELVLTEQELEKWAQKFAQTLRPGDCVCLEGPLGAGKSTLARMILQALGIKTPFAGSPTFAIAHEYALRSGVEAVHMDLYRIKSEQEIEEAGLLSYAAERNAIVLVEWASLFPGAFKCSVRIRLDFADSESQRLLKTS